MTVLLTLILLTLLGCEDKKTDAKAEQSKEPAEQVAGTPGIWNGKANTAWYDSSKTEFTITTADQLAGLAELVADGSSFNGKTVKLGANILLNDTANWSEWEKSPPANKWMPIGISFYKSFRGTFDGAGHVVSGVYIDISDDSQGLFGHVYSGEIKNLGVEASYIKGESNVGALIGENFGAVNNSYFAGVVTGTSNTGGLIGENSGVVTNSYSIGKVVGKGKNIGGLVGNKPFGEIKNSYYDTKASGRSDTAKGDGKAAVWLKRISNFNGWDFTDVWGRKDDINGGFPYLRASSAVKTSNDDDSNIWDGKTWDTDWYTKNKGNNEFQINTAEELAGLARLVNGGNNFEGKTITLARNITLNDTTVFQDNLMTRWTPIGTTDKPFKGTFDGNGYAVVGMFIYYSKSDNQGLFGVAMGKIKNLGVIASRIKGAASNVGLLAGTIDGESDAVENCYSTGEVQGTNNVGGLVGFGCSTVNSSYSTSTVSGKGNNVGGLMGGGCGENCEMSVVNKSYSVGKVTGTQGDVGGLIGCGGRSDSYYDTETSKRKDEYGSGKSTKDMKNRNSFEYWDFESTWDISDDVNNGYPYLLVNKGKQ
jgi:hypothetical protein